MLAFCEFSFGPDIVSFHSDQILFSFGEFSFGPVITDTDILAFCEFSFGPDITDAVWFPSETKSRFLSFHSDQILDVNR